MMHKVTWGVDHMVTRGFIFSRQIRKDISSLHFHLAKWGHIKNKKRNIPFFTRFFAIYLDEVITYD